MTQEEHDAQDEAHLIEEVEERSSRRRRLGVWALVAVLAVLSGVLAYVLIAGGQRQEQVDALEEQLSDTDKAAVEVAEQRQQQARTVLELCESGAIEQDDAGKAACAEAEQAAEQDPAQTVAQAKSGPPGPPGPPGRPGSDGADGQDGTAGEAGEQGAPGSAGADGAPGTDGADGADGDDGAPGAAGAPGEQGEAGPAGDPGKAGSDGKPGSTGAQGATGAKGDPGTAGPPGATGEQGPKGDPGPSGERGPAGADGTDGVDGRGIADAQCGSDGRWDITYTDGAVQDGGPCLVTPETPDPTPTPTEETP